MVPSISIEREASKKEDKIEEHPLVTICCPHLPSPGDHDTQKSLWDFIQRTFKGWVQPKSFLPATPGPASDSATKNPWQLRVSEDQDFCYLPTQPLTLLLPESQSDKGGQTVTGGFARKEKRTATITLHQISGKLTTHPEQAAWMREQKVCKRQADLLSATK